MIEADNIVIATGSRARALGLAGAEFLKTSDDLLSATELPDSIVSIGGGVISLEFAHRLRTSRCEGDHSGGAAAASSRARR